MATDRLANRWGIAVAAVIMQLCLGAVYGWSVFVKPLISTEHWTLTQVSLTFTLSIVFLGVGTVIGGLWQDRVGPRRVATVAGILYGMGYMVAALASCAPFACWYLLWLWRCAGYWHGHGLHLSGCHAGEVVPGPARVDDRSRGVRLRCGRTGDEPARRPGNRLPWACRPLS